MDDEQIRKLLSDLPTAPFIWSAEGKVVIMEEKVVEAGGDPFAVAAWVEAHGGDLDRTLPVVATRRGVTAIPKPKGKRYYVVPEKELAGSDVVLQKPTAAPRPRRFCGSPIDREVRREHQGQAGGGGRCHRRRGSGGYRRHRQPQRQAAQSVAARL